MRGFLTGLATGLSAGFVIVGLWAKATPVKLKQQRIVSALIV
jgi:hypothetical protein